MSGLCGTGVRLLIQYYHRARTQLCIAIGFQTVVTAVDLAAVEGMYTDTIF